MKSERHATAAGWGLLAEFDDPERAVAAARRCRVEGYRRLDAFTPQPVEGLSEALGLERNRMPLIVLVGGIVGGLGGFLMQYLANVYAYPLNVGGRPHDSWPSFIPITFELTVLGAATFGVLGMLALNRLPRPNHPLFDVPAFERATVDRFFVGVRADDPQFDEASTRRFLESLAPLSVNAVPGDTAGEEAP